jgi:hypothetical protein
LGGSLAGSSDFSFLKRIERFRDSDTDPDPDTAEPHPIRR